MPENTHAKNVWNTFKIKNLGDCHNPHKQSDTLLLTGVCVNFHEMCLNT